jgi:hypothetical protein
MISGLLPPRALRRVASLLILTDSLVKGYDLVYKIKKYLMKTNAKKKSPTFSRGFSIKNIID